MRCWPVTSRRSPSWFRSCCSLTVTHRTCFPMAEAAEAAEAVEAAEVEAEVVEAAEVEAAAEVVEVEAEASTDSCST
jgi:hypothetical protein